jgi:hypothetical protein
MMLRRALFVVLGSLSVVVFCFAFIIALFTSEAAGSWGPLLIGLVVLSELGVIYVLGQRLLVRRSP